MPWLHLFFFFRLDNIRHRAIDSVPGEGLGRILDQIGALLYAKVCVIFLILATCCDVGMGKVLSGNGLVNDLVNILAIKIKRKLKWATRAASIGGMSFIFEASRHVAVLLLTLLLDICGFKQFAGDLSRMAGEEFNGVFPYSFQFLGVILFFLCRGSQ